MNRQQLFFSFLATFCVLASLHSQDEAKADYRGFVGVKEVVAEVNPTAGNTANGVVRFIRAGNKVRVVADIEGLTPKAKHGFHIHQNANCGSKERAGTIIPGLAAGGHFDPRKTNAHRGPFASCRDV